MWVKLRRYFISGIVVFLPFALTIYLLILTIQFLDNLLGQFIAPAFMENFGFYFHGLGILIFFILITLIGFFINNFLGRKLYAFFEKILVKLPFFRQVYPAFKEIASFIFYREKTTFKQVVLVEYPRKGVFSLGFVTHESPPKVVDVTKKDLVNVFVPSSPGPLTGFFIMVPAKELAYPDITVEEAIKMIVSVGVVNPV